jgi:hypothetical protein
MQDRISTTNDLLLANLVFSTNEINGVHKLWFMRKDGDHVSHIIEISCGPDDDNKALSGFKILYSIDDTQRDELIETLSRKFKNLDDCYEAVKDSIWVLLMNKEFYAIMPETGYTEETQQLLENGIVKKEGTCFEHNFTAYGENKKALIIVWHISL